MLEPDQDQSSPARRSAPLGATWRSWWMPSLLVILVMVASQRFVTTQRKALEQIWRDNLAATNRGAIAALRQWVGGQKTLVREVARDQVVVDAVQALLNLHTVDRERLLEAPPQARLRSRLDDLCVAEGYSGFLVIDRSGRRVAALSDDAVGRPAPETSERFVRRALKGQTVLSLPAPAGIALPDDSGRKSSGQPTMFVAAPVRDDDERVLAVLAFRLRPKDDFSRVLQTGWLGDTEESYAFNSEGVMISESRFLGHLRAAGLLAPEDQTAVLRVRLGNPGRDLTEDGSAPPTARSAPLTRMAAAAVEGVNGCDVLGYRDYRGIPVLGAWQWLPDLRMGVATEMDAAEVFERFELLSRLGLWSEIFLAVMVLAAGLLWVLNRRHRARAQSSEETLRSVIDSANDAIICVDGHGAICEWNRAAERMFGYSREDLLGCSTDEIIPSSLREPHATAMQAYLRSGVPRLASWEQIELTGLRRDRSEFPLEMSLATTFSGGRRLLVAIVRNVTEHKRIDAATAGQTRALTLLAEGGDAEAVLTTLVETVEHAFPELLASFLLVDDEGKHLRAGPAPTLPKEYTQAVDGLEIGPRAGSCGTAAFRGQRVIVEDIATDPLWEPCRDLGLRFGLRACWSEPVRSRAGKILGTFALYCRQARGPTSGELGLVEQVASVAAVAIEKDRMEASQRWLTRAVQSAAEAIIVTDAGGQILEMNPALSQITGYPAEEVIGKTARVLKSGKHPPEFYAEMWATITTGRTWQGQVVNRKKDGSLYHAALTIAPILDEHGHVMGHVGVQRDVTAVVERETALAAANDRLQAAIDQAEAANRAKSEFLANMSHEIRTPLNGVLGMSELALATDLTPEQREYISTVVDCGESLLGLISDILDLSKIEAGRIELETTGFDLRACVEGAVAVVAPRASEKGIELICNIPDDLPHLVRGDPLRLRQVLINLAGNAIKFTEQGEVEVSVTPVEDSAEGIALAFAVRDTGIGIPADKQDQIFEAFTQADGATTRKYGGTGLGLAISRRIVALMGGELTVESATGRGSAFRFRLLLPNGPPADRSDPPIESTRLRATLRGRRILVVDDNSTNRRFLRTLLLAWDCRVETAPNGSDALDRLRFAHERNQPFDLLLLDLQMPGMDGEQVEQAVEKAADSFGRPAIVLLSSLGALKHTSADPGTTLRAAVLSKPVRQGALLEAMNRALGQAEVDPDVTPPPEGRPEILFAPKILVVEDNPVNTKVALGLLRQVGCEAIHAEHGQAALEEIEHTRFDLVLMDIQMPVLDGLEATRRIREREQETGGHLPILALTAHAMKSDLDRCLDAGMDGSLSKPFNSDELREVIDRFVASAASLAAIPSPEWTGSDC